MRSGRADLIPGGGANFLKGAGGQPRAPPRAPPRTCPQPPNPAAPARRAPPFPPPATGKLGNQQKIIILTQIIKNGSGGEMRGWKLTQRLREEALGVAVETGGEERGHLSRTKGRRGCVRCLRRWRLRGGVGVSERPAYAPYPSPSAAHTRSVNGGTITQPSRSARQALPSRPLRHRARPQRRQGWDGTPGWHLPQSGQPRTGGGGVN